MGRAIQVAHGIKHQTWIGTERTVTASERVGCALLPLASRCRSQPKNDSCGLGADDSRAIQIAGFVEYHAAVRSVAPIRALKVAKGLLGPLTAMGRSQLENNPVTGSSVLG